MRGLKPQTLQIYALSQQGLRPCEIQAKLGVSPTTVSGALWRMRQSKGTPPACRTKPKGFHRLMQLAKFKHGATSRVFNENTTEDIREWVIFTAQSRGYTTLAEFFCDLAVEEFYKEQEEEEEK